MEDQILARFMALKNPAEIDAISRELADFSVRAGFALPGHEPFLLELNTDIPGNALGESVNLGCGIKLVAASVLHEHIARGTCGLYSNVEELLNIPSVQRTPAKQLLLTDLLNHRHGLNCDNIQAHEFSGNGRIDQAALVEALNRNAATLTPGAHYSYSRAGYWLLAAVLQRIEGRGFSEIVAAKGLKVPDSVCPAMGYDGRISSVGLLAFLEQSLQKGRKGEACAPVPVSTSNVFPMPGWHPRELGVQYGWKVLKNGWLGHHVVLRKEDGLIAVHPASGAAIFLWTQPEFSPHIRTRLFGSILPDGMMRIPKRLQALDWAATNSAQYLGSFAAGSKVLRIEAAGPHGISGVLEWTVHRQKVIRSACSYAPAEKNIFYALPRSQVASFIQFLTNKKGEIDAVWNGVRVWPRIA